MRIATREPGHLKLATGMHLSESSPRLARSGNEHRHAAE